MKRHAHGYTDSTNSCDRIISFSSPASDGSLQHLSTEEKACISFLDEIIESTLTEHSDFSSDDSQTFGNTISKKHHCTTCGVHQDMSSCNSFSVTDSSQDLSAEEKDCLKFLEETIDSIEDVGLSTGDAESFPESGCTIVKKHHINQIKTFLVPAPFVPTTSNGSIPTKQGIECAEEKTLPNKDHSLQNDKALSDDASHCESLSCNGCLSTFTENGGVMKPDKDKLEALSKPGLLKEGVMPENKQFLDAPLSSSFPDWPQKVQLEKSFEISVSDDEQSTIQKLSHALSLSLPMVPDVDAD